MKTNLTHVTSVFILMLFSFSIYSQELQNALTEAQWYQLNNSYDQSAQPSLVENIPAIQQLVTCAPDTVEYPFFKATVLNALNINNATSAQAGSQYYDAPQPLTISGFEFYAYSLSAPSSNIIVPVTCEIYLAGPDSIPTGLPLASIVVPVDTTFGMGDLNVLKKTAIFNSPIAVSSPYVVVLTNNSPDGVGLLCNGYNVMPADGLEEYLASVNISGTWFRGYDVTVGGNVFDADWLMHPFVSYDLDADFSFMETGLNVDFTNNVSPIINNRMYNQAAALGNTDPSHEWDFGDMSMIVNMESPSHLYGAPGPYDVTLTETVFGWRRDCSDMESMQVLVPEADISITKDDGQDDTYSGTTSTYIITVTNNGPGDDPAVSIMDVLPMGLTATYTSIATGGATGNTAIGAGDIADVVMMPAGSMVTYTLEAFIEVGTIGTIVNVASATGSGSDPDGMNNSSTDATIILGVIPTLSQWGILIMGMLFMIFGLLFVKYRHLSVLRKTSTIKFL